MSALGDPLLAQYQDANSTRVAATAGPRPLVYSIPRRDRSGASIQDMLMAHAYAFRFGAEYGGACGHDLNNRAATVRSLLRAVNLLGIDSVMCPTDRRVIAWNRMAQLLEPSFFDTTAIDHELAALPELGREILAGKVKGRVVVGL